MRCRFEEPEGVADLAATRLAVLLAALALAGCGVKGPPEPPPGGIQATQAAEAAKRGEKVDTSEPLRPDKKIPILDSLI